MKHLNLKEVEGHVLVVLRTEHEGRERAIKLAALLPIIKERMKDDLVTDRQMRKAVALCAPKICSGSGGLYYPANKDEKRAAIMYQIKKIRGIRRRVDAIARAYPELETYVQLELGKGIQL
jgi:hypothetical protein